MENCLKINWKYRKSVSYRVFCPMDLNMEKGKNFCKKSTNN